MIHTITSTFTLPTLWRYFLAQYGKVFLLSLFGFLALLLSTRLEDFAQFVSLGPNATTILCYIAYQIPYVMQVVLPISSLIASFYLLSKISQTNVLTAIRAAGINLYEVLAPLLLASGLLALLTFQFLLDMSATSHLAAKELQFRLHSMNPLALLHNTKMLEEGGVSVEMKGSLLRDGATQDFIMAIKNGEKNRAALFIAKHMYVDGSQLKGKDLSVITTFDTPNPNHFDHLVIENSKESVTNLDDLSKSIKTKKLRIGHEELRLPLLLAKKNDLKKQLKNQKTTYESDRRLKDQLHRCYSEIAKRISLAFSIVTLTLLGAAFGSSCNRSSKKRLIPMICCTALFLMCYLGGKALENNPLVAIILYTSPHLLIIAVAVQRLQRIQRGIEGKST